MKELISILSIIIISGIFLSCKSESGNIPVATTADEVVLEDTDKAVNLDSSKNVDVNTEESEIIIPAVEKVKTKNEKLEPREKNAKNTAAEVVHNKIEDQPIPTNQNNGAEPIGKIEEPIYLENSTKPQEVIISSSLENETSSRIEENNNKTEHNEEVLSEDKKPQGINMHKEWNDLLNNYVSASGKVNYEGMLAEKNRLESYLALLSNNPPTVEWGRNKKLAYWINAYNAYTVKLIIDNYPLKSITDLEGGKPWDKKWIKIGGETYSLNNIENDIIRPEFNEPRIHFAVNCAAKSCPPLRNEAWNPDQLEEQLESSTKSFINNRLYNTIESGQAKVSKIFEWYAVDFGDLKDFLQKYSGEEIDGVGYKEYDWDLNK